MKIPVWKQHTLCIQFIINIIFLAYLAILDSPTPSSCALSKETFLLVLGAIIIIPSHLNLQKIYALNIKSGSSLHLKEQTCLRRNTPMCIITAAQSVCGFVTHILCLSHWILKKLRNSLFWIIKFIYHLFFWLKCAIMWARVFLIVTAYYLSYCSMTVSLFYFGFNATKYIFCLILIPPIESLFLNVPNISMAIQPS